MLAEIPMLSFVIPAFDEERLLAATLAALHAAAREAGVAYEIVVADDDSSDATAAVAAQGGARVVPVAHRQIAATRNSGARAAGGEVLVFVDADTLVPAAVVREMLRELASGAAGGGAMVRFDEPVPRVYKLLLPAILALYRACRLAGGCFMFCTRPAFEAIGGFDETLFAAEEIAWSRALRRQGRFVLLREPVTTSARKLRAYRPLEMLRIMLGLTLGGWSAVRDRSRLDLWYGARRSEAVAEPVSDDSPSGRQT